MRALILAGMAAVLLAVPASAYTQWTTPGWYQIEDDDAAELTLYIAGPFSDEPSCKVSLPASTDDDHFTCEHLVSRPDWDQ